MSDTVRFSTEGSVGVITLDRPPLNAISKELIADFDTAIGHAAAEEIRAVVVTGAPHFAAGADIKSFKAELDAGGDPAGLGDALSKMLARLERLPKPVIAAVRGVALGGGLEIALACDFRLFGADARCGQSEVALGIFPGAGGTQRLPRLIGLARARDLIYSGRHVEAEEAVSLGIADAVHPTEEVFERALAMARSYATGPTAAIGLAKHAINEGFGLPMGAALALESEQFRAVFATEDAAEGLAAFLEKREAGFQGR